MTIVEYFDPHRLDHLIAYRILEKTGVWPDWFIGDLKMVPNWQILILSKLAEAYLEDHLKEGVE